MKSVTVIGMGPMGQAMAGAYLDKGYEVTVWNRTPARADELVVRGAARAGSVEAALTASDLVVLSLIDHDAVDAVLAQAPETALAGRVFVNLTSDTPDRMRATAAWLAERGAVQLAGGVQVPPPGIGTPEAMTYYSGPEEVIESRRADLEVLTGVHYLGADQGLAPLYYQIGIDMFWTALAGYLHGQAVAEANGISADEFLPHAVRTLDLRYFLEFYAPRITAGHHEGDVDRISMGVASVEHVVRTAEAAGVDGSLPAAVLELFRRGVAAGHGQRSLTSLVEVLKA
ncbi:3-hydroxyisobutyrate dehydrogenase-like beta-hydroxyacid dehydrogenase [Lentzea atacamensis]|uniref:3-hydroxyisobutyrate dehydrogenase-like beta-hydroxyacid dehydrogenase n=1 Tax=Lentzea atacamensis TaxID=531938 RepID=A0A316I3K0_9PSEU|nr:NAD(P)-binding domain-containing protein [Lentzea atacamensis]PWK87976.1 3-hydroxyisobutyrate dehydrogenase-like beta-hydroxyacid dehydrogenase [Lentzea atacamensis]